jgi:hypothetical protein
MIRISAMPSPLTIMVNLLGINRLPNTFAVRFILKSLVQHEPPYQTAQQLDTVLSIPVAYLYCDDDDLAEILLQISSVSDERIREITLAL